MLKKIGIVVPFVLLAVLTLANTPPTDPHGEVVFMPQGPTGPVTIGTPPTDGDALASSDDEEAYCIVEATNPWLEPGPSVWGGGAIDCAGAWAETKLKVVLQRHKLGPWWVNHDTSTLGWYAAPSLITTVDDSCVSGEHTYRVVADGWVKETDDDVKHAQSVSEHRRWEC